MKSVSELNEISHGGNLILSHKVLLAAPLYLMICSASKGSSHGSENQHSKALNKETFKFWNATTYFQLLGLAQRKENGDCKSWNLFSPTFCSLFNCVQRAHQTFLQTGEVWGYQEEHFSWGQWTLLWSVCSLGGIFCPSWIIYCCTHAREQYSVT